MVVLTTIRTPTLGLAWLLTILFCLRPDLTPCDEFDQRKTCDGTLMGRI